MLLTKTDELRRPAWAKSSGHRVFDGYRAEALCSLEEKQCEFQDYLEQLRSAQDKVEADKFMTKRCKQFGPAQPAALQRENLLVAA